MSAFLNNNKLNNISFYKSFKPFYNVLKIFGLAPYSFDFNTWLIKTTFFNNVIVFINLAISFIAFILSCVESFDSSLIILSIAVSGWNFQHLMQTFVAFFVVIHNFIRRREVFKYIKLLNNVDKMVNDLQWKHRVNNAKKRSKIIFWLSVHGCSIVLFTIIIVYATYNDHTSDDDSLLEICNKSLYFFAVQTYMMIIYEFIFSVCYINSQFDCLNKNAKLYLNGFKTLLHPSQIQVNTKVECIKKMALIHNLLNDAIDCINNSYSIEVS